MFNEAVGPTGIESDESPIVEQPPTQGEAFPPIVVEPDPPAVDLSDPTQRFHVLSFARVEGEARATVFDLKTEERTNVVAGDMLDEYKVWLVDMTKRTVKMRGPNLQSVTLKLSKKLSF